MAKLLSVISTRFRVAWLILAWVPGLTQAGQSWSLLTSVSYNKGTYIYDETIENYYFNLGLRYRAPKWAISGTLPFLTRVDNIGLVSDGAVEMISGLGDLYLFGEKTLWESYRMRSTFSIKGQLKLPHGLSTAGFSSNVMDAGLGVSFRRSWGLYHIYADAGYLMLGDPEGFVYADPVSYSLGVGRFFLNGLVSSSLYYKAYTQILDGIMPPKQISLTVISRFTQKAYLSLNGSAGFSESSPDYAVSLGLTRGF